MTNNKANILVLLAAVGAAASVASTASATQNTARPHTITMSGATLLENFVISPASTNDFIDVDGDGLAGSLGTGVEQLATLRPDLAWNGSSWNSNLYWIVQYRMSGSVRGFQELVNYGRVAGVVTTASGNTDIGAGTMNRGYCNRERFVNGAACLTPPSSIANTANPGCMPCLSAQLPDGSFVSPFTVGSSTTPYTGNGIQSQGALRVDIAVSDVPGVWAFIGSGSSSNADFDRIPTTLGYGQNPRASTSILGVPNAGSAGNNKLAVLTGGANLFDPNVTPNADTIFDTELLWAPIGLITNLGTGVNQMDASDVRHLFTTGRRMSGENLVVITRDSGSGTRNGFCNTLCFDPSWGNGDNVGAVPSNALNEHTAGSLYVPSNKGGNPAVEQTAVNNRLSVGFVGVERGFTTESGNPGAEWLSGGKLELIAVRDDLRAPAQGIAYRPTLANILDGNYLIGGPAVVATFGDPRSATVAKGGDVANTNPDVPNAQAAAYINNITRSVEAFISVPGSDETVFSPAERIVSQFILTGALSLVPNRFGPCEKIANANYNATLNNYVRNDPSNILGTVRAPGLGTYGFYSLNGINPARVTGAGIVYSDSFFNPSSNGNGAYVTQGTTGRNGTTAAYNAPANARNRIAFDFNGDGQRSLADASEMLKAWQDRNGGAPWVAPNGTGPIAGASGANAIVEVLGDADSDGNFDKLDVRYWADGLAIVNGKLDRKAGFTAIDNAFMALPGGSSNFFGTTLATGASYLPGDSRGDVANTSGLTTRGFAPIGADRNNNTIDADDNRIDAADIDYVYAQFKTNAVTSDGVLNWNSNHDAVTGDLSCDITGDLAVSQEDVCELVTGILRTQFGDANLDGVVDATDRAIVVANQGQPGGWAMGDFNGDKLVDSLDLQIIDGLRNPCCPGDANGDGLTNGSDLSVLLSQFGAGTVSALTGADFNGDGVVNGSDLSVLLSNFNCQ